MTNRTEPPSGYEVFQDFLWQDWWWINHTTEEGGILPFKTRRHALAAAWAHHDRQEASHAGE